MDHDAETRIEGFSAVVLAGGRSTRMGRNKLLMEVAGRPMVRHVVEIVRGVADPVAVVTGYLADQVEEALGRLPVIHVRSSEGEAAAVLAGLAAFTPKIATLVCVGDQPRLTEREIAGLVAAFLAGTRDRLMVPVDNGRSGYPVIVPRGFDMSGIDPAGELLAGLSPSHIAAFETRNPVYTSDVDTPEDYRALFAL